jgi:gamma-glutamyltranspeptidase/glutathione hydrolase
MTRPVRSIIAAGHDATAGAAATVMAAGGNAFDGAVAALCAACVAEPVLASLGGGGFLNARPADGEPRVYDFFTQTPRRKRLEAELDFFPVQVDFGDATQEFHVGLGAIATPGVVAGLFAVQRDLCRLPVRDLIEPARAFAAEGLAINAFQHRIGQIVAPILHAREPVFALYASARDPTRLAATGEIHRQPQLAAALLDLAHGGPELFYRGAWADRLVADCAVGGGHLTGDDLAAYHVIRRRPVRTRYHGAELYLNPAPSIGGLLLTLTLGLLEGRYLGAAGFGSAEHRHVLATAMRLTQEARNVIEEDRLPEEALDPGLVARLRALMSRQPRFNRGTTQISIADAEGNLASLTLSNGEGAAYALPGTGVVLNNMLGEEDLCPRGFHRWPEDRRISSMMCPTLAQGADGSWTVTGSSGSNRIRSAILQVLSNLIDLRMPLDEAVAAPRIHYESGLLNIEPPAAADVVTALGRYWPHILAWTEKSVFFGGAHSVAIDADGGLHGGADPRRGGVVHRVTSDGIQG